MSQSPPIIYTWTDEAPALATYAFLPIIRAFAGATGVPVETRDISLAGRILAVFPDALTPEQRESDGLAELGELVKTPEANVIKLPNISASIPQMKAAIAELQAKGYAILDEFSCRGFNTNSFMKYLGGMNRGRPNAKDLKRAAEFAEGLKGGALGS